MNDKKTYAPSAFQQAIIEWAAHGTGSAIVVARAGSGKTSLIKMVWRVIPETAHVRNFAFNTAIGGELRTALDEMRTETRREYRNFAAGTFHSVGVGAVARKLGMSVGQLQTDGNKLRNICRDWLGELEQDMYGSFITKLVSLAKGEGIGTLVPDTEDHWYRLVAHHDLYLDSEEADEARAIDLARDLLRRSNDASRGGYIDFDDQLYLPLLWKLRLWQNDWVIVDEAQDTNPVRRAIAKLSLRPGGRLIAVGDDRQAIYGFTGASHDALDLIRAEFNARSFPLTVCYRCAESVVYDAQELVPDLMPAPGKEMGSVTYLPLFARAPKKGEPLEQQAVDVLDTTSAILCRNVAPMVSTAYELMSKGIGCRVLGREIGQGLVDLVKKMKAKNVDGLLAKLELYREREVGGFMAKGQESKAEGVHDRVNCILAFLEGMHERERTIVALIRKIEALFSDDNRNVLTLSTIHKAKGREWDTVAILMPELMPSKFARQAWQLRQEENLDYVARTRARVNLIRLITVPKER